MMTREEIIAANPLKEFVERSGMELKKQGKEWYGKCPFHGDSKPSFRVNPEKQTWFCDPCGVGGSVIDFVMRKDGVDSREALQRLAQRQKQPSGKLELAGCYVYMDEGGERLYEVLRYTPKTFRQRHYTANGTAVWGMEGVRRVLYRLPEVLKAEFVFIVEGEKDADNLAKLGFCTTCNVGGAGKWLDGYTETLKGKNVCIVPDNDDAGRKHADLVEKSIVGKAACVYRIEIPQPSKDVSDFIRLNGDQARAQFDELLKRAREIRPGADLPIRSMDELEAEYVDFTRRSQERALDLAKWIPTASCSIRPLVPGELMAILADTGVGKTAILQNIARSCQLPTIIFELELPGSLMFERFVQMECAMSGDDVYDAYKKGWPPTWRSGGLGNCYVCTKSRISTEEIEKIINSSELKIGERPTVVMVDYIGLINGTGKDRYERISNIAEQMKIIAKATETVVVMASQVARKKGTETAEISIHDAKDSGSIENSAGLVLGCWRESREEMKVKILKNTKGSAGRIFDLAFNGAHLKIEEKPFQP